MVDIHCHIVPRVDDGADSIETALAMIEEAKSLGCTNILTTPHIKSTPSDLRTHEFHRESFDELLGQAPNDIKLHLSCEVRVTSDVFTCASEAKFTANEAGVWILVEMPGQEVPQYFLQALFEYRLAGITPIIAHPERNIGVLRRPEFAIEFVKHGAHLQVTTAALNGEHGEHMEVMSRALLEAGLVSFMASDAHNITARPFRTWNKTFDILADMEAQLVGTSDRFRGMNRLLSHDNALAVCENRQLPSVELSASEEERARKLLQRTVSHPSVKRKRFFFF